MSVSRAQAGAELAAIDDVVKRVKQSRMYRLTGQITILWGVLQIVEYALASAAPGTGQAGSWAIIDALGVALTVWMISRLRGKPSANVMRVVGAFALFYGFGFLWALGLGHLGGREQEVFWRSLFLFGYCLAGLWFGYGFLVLGLSLTAAIFVVYLFAGVWFPFAVAAVSGLGYILCGLWMLRA